MRADLAGLAGFRGRGGRLPRIAATALITAGLVVLLEVGLTLVWLEPISSVQAWSAQRNADAQLGELDRSFARHHPQAATAGRREIRRLANGFAARVDTGQPIGRIEIPRIDLNAVMIEGTDTDSLEKGPGHYPETALPGQRGTVGIAGHRTTYLAPFRNIDELGPGDRIVIEMPYGRFAYRFEKQRIVDPSRVGVVRNVNHDRIALTACHPLYSASQRIVVFARLIQADPPSEPGQAARGLDLSHGRCSGRAACSRRARRLVIDGGLTFRRWRG